jgi:Ca2+-binding RTX toxin-like protein
LVSRTNYDLIVKITDADNSATNDQITIQNWFSDSRYKIEQFVFADGASWDTLQLGTNNADTLTGTDKNDYLAGGLGADTLSGGLGNDYYLVDNTGDRIIENTDAGIDTVQSSITYTLGANLENLTLTGTAAIKGIGNELDNLLMGNGANNNLMGGAGADTLSGNLGNDILNGGKDNDTYLFNAGDGKDSVTEIGGADVAVLTGIRADQLWFKHIGNHLVMSRIGTKDAVTFKNWYLQTSTKNTHVETFTSGDGKTLLDTAVENLVQAMASLTPPRSGQTTLPENYLTRLNAVITGSWQ